MSDILNLILEPLAEVFQKFRAFLPNLLAMLVILIVGITAARIVRAILVRILKAINFDAWADRMGVTALLRKGDLWAKPSRALGAIFFWVLIIFVLMTGLSALKIEAIDSLVSQFFAYLPRAFSAILILIIGALFDRLAPVLWVIAILGNLTVIHRVIYTWRETRRLELEQLPPTAAKGLGA